MTAHAVRSASLSWREEKESDSPAIRASPGTKADTSGGGVAARAAASSLSGSSAMGGGAIDPIKLRSTAAASSALGGGPSLGGAFVGDWAGAGAGAGWRLRRPVEKGRAGRAPRALPGLPASCRACSPR